MLAAVGGAHMTVSHQEAMPDARSEARDLMLRFCTISGNCEFGAAQRAFGAEPLDLFRWGNTGIGALMRILRARFEGIGDPEQITVWANPRGEYHVRHQGFGFNWHAFTKVTAATPEEVRQRECRRLPFLARKLIEELEGRQRIFVVKCASLPLPGIMRSLHAAAALYGSPDFLLVTEGTPPTVSRDNETGFLLGTIPKFADPARVPGTTDAESWRKLCALTDVLVPHPSSTMTSADSGACG